MYDFAESDQIKTCNLSVSICGLDRQSMTIASGMMGFFDRIKQGIIAAGRSGNSEISEEVRRKLRILRIATHSSASFKTDVNIQPCNRFDSS